MRVFALKPDHLRILDTALHGRLADALADVAREGGDPVLGVERRTRQPDGTPSAWFVIVSSGKLTHRFEVNTPAGLRVAAQIYLRDHVTELTEDLSALVHAEKADEQLEFDFHHPWPRPQSGDPS